MPCEHKPEGKIDTGVPAASRVPARAVLPTPVFMDKSACPSVARVCVPVKLCPKISMLCCDNVCSQ